MTQKRITIADLIKEYFMGHPNEDLSHGPVVDYVEENYVALYGPEHKPRDPWRSIRSLHQKGFLIKVRKGIYRYDPDAVTDRTLEDFTPAQKNAILERGQFRCARCGKGEKEGVELHVDHIKPHDLGGEATLENGQVLCAQHNFLKKTLNQTETGKRMFIQMYELAQSENQADLASFCIDVLSIYEKHGMNSHIVWNR